MSKPLKIGIFFLGSLAALMLMAVAALFLLDLSALKPRIEATASRALGLELHINGRIGLGFPDLSITLSDVQLRNHDANIADAEEVHLNVDLAALFRDDMRVREIGLKGATVFIERGADGRLNLEPAKTQRGERTTALALTKLTISDSTVYYADVKSEADVEARDCDIDSSDFVIEPGKQSPLLNLSFTAKIACDSVQSHNVELSDVKLSAALGNGVLHLDPMTMKLFGGEGSASLHLDFSEPVSVFSVRYSLERFRIEEFLRVLSPQKIAHGDMNFFLEVSGRGTTWDRMKRALNGRASLRGKHITVKGGNLDEELSRFESSQRFNLVDVGALFFAGPMGLAVTKGYNFASMLTAGEGVSHVRAIVSDWSIKNGVATATDAAMATNLYRIALKGELDFANERFKDVTVALVDDSGCPKVRQKLSGSFRKPVIERPNVLTALAGPALNLLSGAKNLVTGKQCTVFYAGSVPSPTQKDVDSGSGEATK